MQPQYTCQYDPDTGFHEIYKGSRQVFFWYGRSGARICPALVQVLSTPVPVPQVAEYRYSVIQQNYNGTATRSIVYDSQYQIIVFVAYKADRQMVCQRVRDCLEELNSQEEII